MAMVKKVIDDIYRADFESDPTDSTSCFFLDVSMEYSGIHPSRKFV
jgi:hypothetical protein